MKTSHLISAVCGTILKVVVAVAVIMLIYKGAMMAYDYGYRVFMEPPMSAGEGRTVSVAVTDKMSPTEMGDMLYSKGLIRDPRLFVVQYLLSEYRKDVKPGVYDLSTAMTAEEMLQVMAANQVDEGGSNEGNSEPGRSGDAGGSGAAANGGDAGGEDAESEEGGTGDER